MVNQKDKGPKICLNLHEFREILLGVDAEDGSEFRHLKGYVFSKNKDGRFAGWWTESNIGDAGANEKQSFFMKFVEKDRSHQELQNSKVNFENPVAKQRGSEYVVIDATNLQLSQNQTLYFKSAMAKFYESNFWIKFKSIGFTSWLAMILAVSIKSYRGFGGLEEPPSHWTKRLFLGLELVDMGKDFVYLYSRQHKPWIFILFS